MSFLAGLCGVGYKKVTKSGLWYQSDKLTTADKGGFPAWLVNKIYTFLSSSLSSKVNCMPRISDYPLRRYVK